MLTDSCKVKSWHIHLANSLLWLVVFACFPLVLGTGRVGVHIRAFQTPGPQARMAVAWGLLVGFVLNLLGLTFIRGRRLLCFAWLGAFFVSLVMVVFFYDHYIDFDWFRGGFEGR